MLSYNTQLNCILDIEEEEDDDDDTNQVSLWINLYNDRNKLITTLEYSDITQDYNDFLEINEHYDLYDNIEELGDDIASGYLSRFVNMPRDIPRLDLIINLRMKMQHQTGKCGNSCILCNPDIGDDPFPDFTFDIRNIEPEGEA